MKPNDVYSGNEQQLLNTMYKYEQEYSKQRRTAKFRIGDHVRMSEYRAVFDKSYTPNWSTLIFTIRKVQYNTEPITYLIDYVDVDGDVTEIEGCMYPEELQHVKYPKTYIIEKIIRRKDGKAFVKWLGFGEESNSWIPESELVDYTYTYP